jgi:hypothetical protein
MLPAALALGLHAKRGPWHCRSPMMSKRRPRRAQRGILRLTRARHREWDCPHGRCRSPTHASTPGAGFQRHRAVQAVPLGLPRQPGAVPAPGYRARNLYREERKRSRQWRNHTFPIPTEFHGAALVKICTRLLLGLDRQIHHYKLHIHQ